MDCLNRIGAAFKGEKPASSKSKISELRTVGERATAQNCSSGCFTLKFHLGSHVVENSAWFGTPSFTDGTLLEHYEVVIDQFYRTTSLWYLKRLYETAPNMSRTLEIVQRWECEIHVVGAGAFLLKKRDCVKDDGGYLVRGGMCKSLQQLKE